MRLTYDILGILNTGHGSFADAALRDAPLRPTLPRQVVVPLPIDHVTKPGDLVIIDITLEAAPVAAADAPVPVADPAAPAIPAAPAPAGAPA